MCVCVPRKSACSVQLCVIINDDRERGSKAGRREGGTDFAGQSCVQRAGLMDLLRWRHVDMPRARTPSRVESSRVEFAGGRVGAPWQFRAHCFMGRCCSNLKCRCCCVGCSAGVASCKWNGEGSGRAAGSGQRLMATTLLI